MRDFRNLDVWTKSHNFTLRMHHVTETFPRAEMLGLASTLRRRSSAMTMKIAEGCGKDDQASFAECLAQARGIGMEVEYQLLLARDLQLIETAAYDGLQGQLVEVRRMLSGLMKSVHSGPA